MARLEEFLDGDVEALRGRLLLLRPELPHQRQAHEHERRQRVRQPPRPSLRRIDPDAVSAHRPAHRNEHTAASTQQRAQSSEHKH